MPAFTSVVTKIKDSWGWCTGDVSAGGWGWYGRLEIDGVDIDVESAVLVARGWYKQLGAGRQLAMVLMWRRRTSR